MKKKIKEGEQMFCENCGAKLPDDAVFCSECGHRTVGAEIPGEAEAGNMEGASPELEPLEFGQSEEALKDTLDDFNIPDMQEPPQEPEKRHKEPKRGHTKKVILICGIAVCAVAILIAVYILLIRPAMSGGTGETQPAADTGSESTEAEISEETPESLAESEEESFSGGSFTVTRSGTTSGTPETATEGETATGETQAAQNVVHEYQVVHGSMTWDEARQYCEEQGGHLATITSQEEYDQVIALLDDSGLNVAWLGATDKDSVGAFKWVTGEEFSFADWASGEPNNETGDEFYLVMYKVSGDWVWNDGPIDTNTYYSDDTVGFVCEWDKTQ